MAKPLILILEDDPVLLETLKLELEERYRVETAGDGRCFLDHTFHHRYDLYLMDINVPEIDGLTLLEELRFSGDDTPAIFLSARREELERMEGFRAGCDDYLGKPFSIGELKLRIEALLRRSGRGSRLVCDEIEIDRERNRLIIDGQEHTLEPKELEILRLFLAHPGEVITIDRIVREIYGHREPSPTVIRVHISKINALFARKRIHNLRGVGYRYEHP